MGPWTERRAQVHGGPQEAWTLGTTARHQCAGAAGLESLPVKAGEEAGDEAEPVRSSLWLELRGEVEQRQ
jgi:hypothetical protein